MNKGRHQDKELDDTASTDGSDELYERLNLKVDKGQEPLRIDKFLVRRIESASRNKIQKALEAGMVLVNNKEVQPNYKIRPLDEIVVYSEKEAPGEEIIPEELPLNIRYEDDEVMIINKPPGMVVHPASGNYTGTLINGVAWYLRQRDAEISEQTLPRFGLVHRIDKNTSGLMVLAKTERAVRSLAKQFFDHTVRRQYMALVWGDLAENAGTIVAHVGRHQRFRKLFDAYPEGDHGKEAITHYKVLERFGYVTLVQCVLETGRTHQIRVHMAALRHPCCGDLLYGADPTLAAHLGLTRQWLHAVRLAFEHPGTGREVIFESAYAPDLQHALDVLSAES